MNTKKLWLDKGVIINDLKRYWWTMAVYFIAMIFFAVLPMTSSRVYRNLGLREINNCLFADSIYVQVQ